MCAVGLRKKFDLAFQEVTSISAVYDRHACPHRLIADHAEPNIQVKSVHIVSRMCRDYSSFVIKPILMWVVANERYRPSLWFENGKTTF